MKCLQRFGSAPRVFYIGATSKIPDATTSINTSVSGENELCIRGVVAWSQNCMVDQKGVCLFMVIANSQLPSAIDHSLFVSCSRCMTSVGSLCCIKWSLTDTLSDQSLCGHKTVNSLLERSWCLCHSVASGILKLAPVWKTLGADLAFTGADNTGMFSRIGKSTW